MTTIRYAPARIGVFPYESPLDGVQSDSEAFNRAINDIICCNNRSSVVEFSGPLVLTQPPPVLDRVTIEGDDPMGSTILKRYPGGILFHFAGRPGFSGGGLVNFSIPTDTGSAGSYTIMGRARADGYAPDNIRLERLYIGSGGNPNAQAWRHLELIGSARTSPVGVREPLIRDVTIFGSIGGEYLDTLVAADVDNLQVFPAPRSSSSLTISNCIGSSFDDLNIQVAFSRPNNSGCGFTNKMGQAF